MRLSSTCFLSPIVTPISRSFLLLSKFYGFLVLLALLWMGGALVKWASRKRAINGAGTALDAIFAQPSLRLLYLVSNFVLTLRAAAVSLSTIGHKLQAEGLSAAACSTKRSDEESSMTTLACCFHSSPSKQPDPFL
jgi:hypothetical protein